MERRCNNKAATVRLQENTGDESAELRAGSKKCRSQVEEEN